MEITILVDSDEFWTRLNEDISLSNDSIFIQTFSFEADSAGKMLSNSLLSSSAADRRILVDSYTKMILSDKFLYSPKNLLNSELRREVKETAQMIENLKNGGIKVKFTNPIRFSLSSIFARNHKKLVVIDDKIAYIGGINFCEHNFYWHDMMIRIAGNDIARFMKQDFLSTWEGQNQGISKRFENIAFYIFDGRSNETMFEPILKLIGDAKNEVYVESPYLTFPFFNKLKEVSNKGVPVTIITSDLNNKQFMKDYLLWESAKSSIELKLYQKKMTHLKALLIDDDFLIVGSSNFDFLSYRLHQDIVAVITDADVISNFKERIIREDLKNSRKFEGEVNSLKGYISYFGLKFLEKFLHPQ